MTSYTDFFVIGELNKLFMEWCKKYSDTKKSYGATKVYVLSSDLLTHSV